MKITPTQTSFAPAGAPPEFAIDTGGLRYYSVQVATDPLLFNGANVSRRTPANFFDSWSGDVKTARGSSSARVAGQQLEARTGKATYKLPPEVWARMRTSSTLYYRVLVSKDPKLGRPQPSVADVDAARAPSVTIATLPARPARSPVAAFTGKNVLKQNDFPKLAKAQLGASGIVQGRDGDFRFVVLDATRFDMTVVECHESGLMGTIDKMPRKPDAVINGQFLSGAVGLDTEGQVVREGTLINSDSQTTRYYVSQVWNAATIAGFRVGRGNPAAAVTDSRAAFGGLGPVLIGGAPVAPLNAWAQSIYDKGADIGRGVIAVERNLGLILLIVQENFKFTSGTNTMTMAALRKRLQDMGFEDAVFNDGSDSESLFAFSGWLLKPGAVKDFAMDFAIGFVDRKANRRLKLLAIDGTKTADGKTFKDGVQRPVTTHYSPRNISGDLQPLAALSGISGTFRNGVIEAWRAPTSAQADVIMNVIESGGAGGHYADLLYVSSHAWRHGQLWYHPDDDATKGSRNIADIWSSSFKPVWRNSPRWLIIAGCGVLGLHYSRGIGLTTSERSLLSTWHRQMHGSSASVPGLTGSTKVVFETFHPGWAWYDRVFRRNPGLRGVLGYWYRSPAEGQFINDIVIMTEFSERLRKGEPFLDAWESSNRQLLVLDAAWAAMVRENCEGDTLAALEEPTVPPGGEWKYYDRFQNGALLPAAFKSANSLTDSKTINGVGITFHPDYDKPAIGELEALPFNAAGFLRYNDGLGPP